MIGGARPSENLTATVGSIVAAFLGVVAVVKPGFNLAPGAVAAIIGAVAWIAHGITWYISRKQKAGELASAPDGEVVPS